MAEELRLDPLTSELGTPTEPKTPGLSTILRDPGEGEEVKTPEDVLDPEGLHVTDDPEPQEVLAVEEEPYDARANAEALLGLLDIGNILLLPMLYERVLLRPGDRVRRKEVLSTPEAKRTESDLKLLDLINDVDNLKAGAAFTEDEMERNLKAMERVMEKHRIKVSVEMQLVAAMMACYSIRLMPLVGANQRDF